MGGGNQGGGAFIFVVLFRTGTYLSFVAVRPSVCVRCFMFRAKRVSMVGSEHKEKKHNVTYVRKQKVYIGAHHESLKTSEGTGALQVFDL